jgi:hypothetical protein
VSLSQISPVAPDSSTANSSTQSLANLVAQLSGAPSLAGDRILPVSSSIRNLFPDGGLRRGSTVVVSGSTSLALSAMATASAEGSWCAAINLPSLGLVAASEMGVELSRLALVPRAGQQWAAVTAALLDALDVVLVHPLGHVRDADARRLSARARESGSVLIPVMEDGATWSHADLRLRCDGLEWQGLGAGHGYLRKQQLRVLAEGRGAASRSRQALVSLHSTTTPTSTHQTPLAS